MKRKEFIESIKGNSKADLVAKAKSLAEELMKLRFRKASGQLEQAHHIPAIRRNLARVRTALTAVTKQDAGLSAKVTDSEKKDLKCWMIKDGKS